MNSLTEAKVFPRTEENSQENAGCWPQMVRLCMALALSWASVASAQSYRVLKSFAGGDGDQPYTDLALGGNTLYGTTYAGGAGVGAGVGVVFKINTDGSDYAVLKSFGGSDGYYPYAGLVLAAGTLYGTTYSGGSGGGGVVFSVNTDGSAYTVLKSFSGPDGQEPAAGLTLVGDTLYGSACYGGASGFGLLFRVRTDGSGYSVLKDFGGGDGSYPRTRLVAVGSTLYGTTYSGGSGGRGVVFSVNTDGSGYTMLKSFDGSDGSDLTADLVLGGSTLYGTAAGSYGGNRGASFPGVVFKVNTDGSGYSVLKYFDSVTGPRPYGGLALEDGVLYGTAVPSDGSSDGVVFRIYTDGSGYTVLTNLTGSDGMFPEASLLLAGGTLYGTTALGGDFNKGVVFSLQVPPIFSTTPTILTNPASQTATVGATVDLVAGAAGASPLAYQWFFDGTNALSEATSSVLHLENVQLSQAGFYAVVVTNAFGAVTSAPAMLMVTASPPVILTPPSSQTVALGDTVVLTISSAGSLPLGYQWLFNASPIPGAGTTSLELTDVQVSQSGSYTVIITNAFGAVTSPPAVLTVLDPAIVTQPADQLVILGTTASFSVVAAGTAPLGFQWFKDSAQLDNGGNISGAQTATLTLEAVSGGDAGGYCVVISNPSGTVTSRVAALTITNPYYSVVHRFTGYDGSFSVAGLAASGSTLYGTTSEGGSFGQGTVFKVNTDGSGYALLHQYLHNDGVGPCGDLLLSGTKLYGTTYMGGGNNYGTVFKISTDGNNHTLLQQFNYQDGGEPYAGLALSDTTLYGVTSFTPVLFKVSTDGSGYTVLRRFTSRRWRWAFGQRQPGVERRDVVRNHGRRNRKPAIWHGIPGQHRWERLHRRQEFHRERRVLAERGPGAVREHAVRHDG